MSGKESQHYGGTVQGLGHWEMALLNTEPKSTMQSYKYSEREKITTIFILKSDQKTVTSLKKTYNHKAYDNL